LALKNQGTLGHQPPAKFITVSEDVQVTLNVVNYPPPPKKFKLILIYIYLQKELDVFSKVNKQLKKKKGSGRQSFIN
jgi:hypothetical protein